MNKLVEFDTNIYLGETTKIGYPIVDSEEYTLKYINICLNIPDEIISTEGIIDTFVKIKESILKLLGWMIDNIARFIDMIKN